MLSLHCHLLLVAVFGRINSSLRAVRSAVTRLFIRELRKRLHAQHEAAIEQSNALAGAVLGLEACSWPLSRATLGAGLSLKSPKPFAVTASATEFPDVLPTFAMAVCSHAVGSMIKSLSGRANSEQ